MEEKNHNQKYTEKKVVRIKQLFLLYYRFFLMASAVSNAHSR